MFVVSEHYPKHMLVLGLQCGRAQGKLKTIATLKTITVED